MKILCVSDLCGVCCKPMQSQEVTGSHRKSQHTVLTDKAHASTGGGDCGYRNTIECVSSVCRNQPKVAFDTIDIVGLSETPNTEFIF